MAARSHNSGGQNPEFILREFQGMNLIDAREAINDDEFYWCENVIPVGSGAAYPVGGPTAALATIAETGAPSYTMTFNAFGTDYGFAVWSNSGHGWIVNLTSFATTQIITGLTSGQTSATQYSNQGLLIIDPTGYWDWNVTTPNTLTPQNNALANSTLVFSNIINGGTQLKNTGVVAGGGGSGATVQTTWKVNSVAINAAGTGYAVGDSLLLTDGNPSTPAQIIVSSIGGGGTITGISLATGGAYPGPLTSTLVATGPTGNTVSGGSGSTATFTVKIIASSITVLNRGTGYTGSPFYQDLISTNVAQDQFNLTSSGVIGGTSIATYAGRVWIAFNRTGYFTDINSYNSFGGVGGSFFINDSYLHNNITAFYAANNYLYIFGDTSIDALSNVTVTGGVTFFTRINITTAVGTSTPTSIFGYYRAIIFYHASGFYQLSGATPEKISQKISDLINVITTNGAFPLVYGATVLVHSELCACLSFVFTDTFTAGGPTGTSPGVRSIFALYFRGRWWVSSLITTPGVALAMQGVFSVSVSGTQTLFSWAANSLYRAFSASALMPWLIKTKTWDAGAPLYEKQSINAALAATWAGGASSGVTLKVDTEVTSSGALTVPLNGSPVGYQLDVLAANEGGNQYLGLTANSQAPTNASKIRLLALRGKAEHNFLA
jgi:hypothetical protein